MKCPTILTIYKHILAHTAISPPPCRQAQCQSPPCKLASKAARLTCGHPKAPMHSSTIGAITHTYGPHQSTHHCTRARTCSHGHLESCARRHDWLHLSTAAQHHRTPQAHDGLGRGRRRAVKLGERIPKKYQSMRCP